jgi:hypothetical protein
MSAKYGARELPMLTFLWRPPLMTRESVTGSAYRMLAGRIGGDVGILVDGEGGSGLGCGSRNHPSARPEVGSWSPCGAVAAAVVAAEDLRSHAG